MKLKRSEFTFTFVLLALFAVTASVQLLSAYGAMCSAWFPAYLSPHIAANLWLYRLSNIVTWIGSLFWGYVIYAVLTQKKGAYLMALITSSVSFIMGLIPAIISDTASWTSKNEGPLKVPWSIGSPHWGRVFANAMVVIVLLIPPMRRSVQKFASAENRMTGNVAQQIIVMSIFFFWLSIVSFLGTNFMAGAHMSYGVNIWELVQAQNIGAWTTGILGISMLSGGFILKQFKPSRSLITITEGNH
jgi:hypothetical protein